jgi:putative endonuclease
LIEGIYFKFIIKRIMKSKLDQGNRGEQYAVEFLVSNEFQIVERNFRIRGGEIDIIAIETDPRAEEKTLVFLEVKTRSSHDFGEPLEAIGYYKMRALIKATQFYKMKHPKLPDLMRIDAVSVLINDEGQLLDIELVKNITG